MTIDTSALSSLSSASGGHGVLFAKKGITTIGEALAVTSGFTKGATVADALQTRSGGQTSSTSLGPIATPLVTDFINAKLDEFSTSDKAARDSSRDVGTHGSDSAATPVTSDGETERPETRESTSDGESAPTAKVPETSSSQITGAYTAVASSSTSTIRGTGVDLVT